MKKLIVILLCTISLQFSCTGQNNIEEQIKSAVLAAPAAVRDGAHVYGFNEKGEMITLREGTNNFVVRADDPTKEGFEVVSYPKDVEPFMARGRELRAEGKNRGEVLQIREEEMMNGSLQKPNYGSTLAIYYGENAKYNPETNELEGGQFRYVIYTPLATAESTGLPISPNGKGHPWVMFPGLYRAHIMVTPAEGN
ncbi:hypothetical protein [uncultured Roseivirga sp.]|uniref:hypothetical protein n=1 Tax=uncultured Roseivirga sp. TaxID=543088 RepID=UPI000D7924E2|nr:hypothetical protein [uncultured Roseivirga sp.]PWL31798.1 MAG: hypothetical protein DCO95_01015 [Roseivirga sp. XM-24bin3]